MTIESVRVSLGRRSYDILIGPGLLSTLPKHVDSLLLRPKLAIITDRTVAETHLAGLCGGLERRGIKVDVFVVEPGEASKSWSVLRETVEWLLSIGTERNDIVAALGGGVIGDLAGFAAAILRRGVRLVQLPTTLLAQVDSSVGGKTGINSTSGKNLVGAFHQPSLVVADTEALRSLDRRQFLAGYGEVAKYGLLGDRVFFDWLEANSQLVAAMDETALIAIVRRCCEIKAAIVQADETEQGQRALLNLGHTFGHALEAAYGYTDRLLHGEAVAIGCGLAATLSSRLGYCRSDLPAEVRSHFRRMGMKDTALDVDGPRPAVSRLMALIDQDKKVVMGKARYVLLREIGDAFVAENVDPGRVRDLLSTELG